MKVGVRNVNFSRKSISYLIIIIPIVFFIFFVGRFNYLEYNSYIYTQFDLGVSYRTLLNFHVTYHLYNWPIPIFETPETFSKLIYIPLSFTLYIYNSPLTLLFDQIIFIAIGGGMVFFVSKKLTGDFLLSFILEMIYFLYPSTYGFMTQGGNLMVFFEPLLLIGYYFYIENKHALAVTFVILASITNELAPVLLVIFFLIPHISNVAVFIRNYIKKNNQLSRLIHFEFRREQLWHIIFLIVPIIIFFMSVKLYGVGGLLASARVSSLSTASSSPDGSFFQALLLNFSSKVSFLNMVFEPLLYLPVLSLYSIPIFIYLIVAWYSNQPIYYDILTRQYPYLFAGFIFISLVHVFKKTPFKTPVLRKLAILLIISSLVSFALYSPFSLSNLQSGNLNNASTVTPIEKNLTTAFNLIPMNASVLVQNDIVQLDNRQQVFFPGYYNNEEVDYAVFAPVGVNGINNAYSGFSPAIGNSFANNASYGLYVRLGNVEIYKLHYVGVPVIFSNETFGGQSGFYVRNWTSYNNITFSTGFLFLSPGSYNLTFSNVVVFNSDLYQKNISVKISLLGSDGYSSVHNYTFHINILPSDVLSFSGRIQINNFDSYAINLGLELPRTYNFTYLGPSRYHIVSVQ